MSPSCSSLVMTGSRLEMASSSPFCMAATAVGPVPTRMNAASSGFSPAFTIMYIDHEIGGGAGRGDADLARP